MYRMTSVAGYVAALAWCSACAENADKQPSGHVSVNHQPVGGFNSRSDAEEFADEDSDTEAEWAESCSGEADAWQCDYDDGYGTVCHVEGDADEWLSEACEGEWGSYVCAAADGVFACTYTDPEGTSCEESYDSATLELIESSCAWWSEGDDEFIDECSETEDGTYACVYDDGEWACAYEVTVEGETLSSECEGPDGTYQSCALTDEGQLACESFDGTYACEELYDDEGLVEYSCIRVDALDED